MTIETELWVKQRRRLQSDEEWRTWEFLYPLSRVLDKEHVSVRKLSLFTAACVRQHRGSGFLGEHDWVIEGIERQADTPIPTEANLVAHALREVRLRCTEVMGGMYWQASIDYSEEPETDPWRVAWGTADAMIVAEARRVRVSAGLADEHPEGDERAAAERVFCDLLRDIFGNPFRPVPFDPKWRTSTAVLLAKQMYESRDFSPMPILADALQDAGCGNPDILNHCRDTSLTHVRGCWVVDLVLGKS
jgi:hypothetical protein